MIPTPPAIVIGMDSMQGLQTARILASEGVPVIGYVGVRHHHAAFTRVCAEIRHTESEDHLLEDLERLGERLTTRAVLVPCTDGKVKTVSKARHALASRFEVVLPAHETVEILMDKSRFLSLADERGLPVPRALTVRDEADFARAVDSLRFPLVLKPSFRTKQWTAHTTDKAFRATDPSAAWQTWHRVREWTDSFVVQEWVRGGPGALYSCNVYFSKEGQLLTSFVARKLRQWPLDTGQSALGEEIRNDRVRELTVELLESVDYRGLGYVEIKRDSEDGDYRIIEPNVGRPTGRSAIAEGGGVRMLYTMYCDATDRPLPAEREQQYTGVKWIHIRRDCQASIAMIRRRDLSLREWIRSVRGKKVYAVFSLRDPLPFLVDIVEAVAKLVQRDRDRERS